MYKKITKEEYEKIGKKIFTGFGFDERDSSIITDVLMQADLFGIESHGISRISKYDKKWGFPFMRRRSMSLSTGYKQNL